MWLAVVVLLCMVTINNVGVVVVEGATNIGFASSPAKTNTLRLGLNIGGRDAGNHAIKNIINNPGFEAAEKATVMQAAATSNTTHFYQAQWGSSSAQPDGYWNNAQFIWTTGQNQGQQGTIARQFSLNGNYVFQLTPPALRPVAANDVLVVRKQFGSSFRSATDTRPSSPGIQSYNLSVADSGSQYTVYYDGGYRDIDYTQGKAIIIQGPWTLSLWVRAATVGETFSVYFGREQWNGGNAFLSKTYTLSTTAWQHIVENLTVTGDPATASPTTPCSPWPSCGRPMVQISLSKSSGSYVLIDDFTVSYAGDTNPTVFPDTFVNRIKDYNPGTLRYWGGQLGASLQSQTAPELARRTNGYKPSDGTLGNFEFGLHDFLVLCKTVGAQPWWVMPPSFFPDELDGLLQYLSATSGSWASVRINQGQTAPWTSVFSNIFIEFGNELWGDGSPNDPFGGASMGGVNEGIAGNYSFAHLKANSLFNKNVIKLILGGQAGWSGQNQLIQNGANAHDLMGLAPYFGDLTTYDTPINQYGPLWAFSLQENNSGNFRSTQQILANSKQGTGLAIYEINFGFLNPGNPPPSVRNPWMIGTAGGLNLPWAMLNYLKYFGAQPMNAFTILGYSAMYSGSAWPAQCQQPTACAFAKPWGLLRDLDRIQTKRPTWLAVEVVNKAILPILYSTVQSGDNPSWTQQPINSITSAITVPYVNSFGFADGKGKNSLVAFNFHLTQTLQVTISPLATPSATATIYTLTSTNPTDTNEEGTVVSYTTTTISNFASGYALNLPPFSVSTITWTNK